MKPGNVEMPKYKTGITEAGDADLNLFWVEVEELDVTVFLRWCRKRIIEAVEDKITCPNEKEIILSIIAPNDYKRGSISHCITDCWNKSCFSYRVPEKENNNND